MPIDVWFFLLLVTPPLVLVHELGHALVGLARTRGVVHVVIGAPPSFLRARIGRLALELSLRQGRGVAGYARTYALGVPAFERLENRYQRLRAGDCSRRSGSSAWSGR
jgi:hypothetical protein